MLEFVITKGTPDVLNGDYGRIQQILFNVVGNAIKFTDKGSVQITVMPLPYLGESDVRLLFTVMDSGVGISDAILDKIVEPFVQGEDTYARRFQGAGLGLSIVRRLINMMGGGIAIESDVGIGTTVYLSIPLALPDSIKSKTQAWNDLSGRHQCPSAPAHHWRQRAHEAQTIRRGGLTNQNPRCRRRIG